LPVAWTARGKLLGEPRRALDGVRKARFAGEQQVIEFKGYTNLPIECKTSTLRLEDGKIKVPTGPGIGVDIDPDYIKKYVAVQGS